MTLALTPALIALGILIIGLAAVLVASYWED